MSFSFAFKSSAENAPVRRSLKAYTIDNKHTKTPEDAINIKRTKDGHYRVCISVSDVGFLLAGEGAKGLLKLLQLRHANLVHGSSRETLPESHLDLISLNDEIKNRLRFRVGESVPSLAVEFTIDSYTGRVREVDVFHAQTRVNRSFFFEDGRISLRAEKEFADLFFGVAAVYAASRPLLPNFKKGNMSLSSYLSAIIVSSYHAMGMFVVEKKIPSIYSGKKSFLHNSNLVYGIFDSFEQACQTRDEIEKKQGKKHEKPVVELMSSEYSLTPIRDTQTNASARIAFSSPLRQIVDFVNVMQISAHLSGEEYPFSAQELLLITGFLNRNRASFDRALSAAELPIEKRALPFR